MIVLELIMAQLYLVTHFLYAVEKPIVPISLTYKHRESGTVIHESISKFIYHMMIMELNYFT